MGRKRKRECSNERLLKKLRRLEERIRARKRSDSISISDYSTDSENYTYRHEGKDNTYYSPNNALPELEEVVTQETTGNEEKHLEDNREPSTSGPSVDTAEEVNHLDEEILQLLGDAPKEQSPVGPEVHADIASRLEDILQNGLKKEIKEKIVEENPVPGNCALFKAPILNPEVRAAVSDVLEKKDASLAARQGQIGVALSALVRAMNILVLEKSDTNQDILKHISSACRILCDTHYIDTKLRRNFLISTLNNKIKDTLKESKRDKNLFGEELAEKLKATKAITKSSQDLRYMKPKSTVIKPATLSSTNNLNWKHPQANHQPIARKSAPINHRTAGAVSTYQPRSRPEVDTRRRQPAPRARATVPYKRRP